MLSVLAQSPALANLAARASIGTGSNTVTSGFVIGPGGSEQVLLRAVGPGRVKCGISPAVSDPNVVLINSGGIQIGSNSGWLATDAGALSSVGAFALAAGSHEDAIL